VKCLVYISMILLAIGCTDAPTDWSPYYESQHTQAYGTEVFQDQLNELYPSAKKTIIKNRTPEFFEDYYGQNSTYFYINTNCYINDTLFEDILHYTKSNNSVFIATDEGENDCYNKLGISMNYAYDQKYFKLTLKHLHYGDKEFTLKNRPTEIAYFSKIPTNAQVLGTIEIADSIYPNFIALNRLQGSKILLHANPELFSNYHLLHENDAQYSLNTLSHLMHTNEIIWDGFGTRRRYFTPPSEGDSADLLRYITKHKSLLLALLCISLMIGLFLLFNYKRVVRAMPVHSAQQNNSIAFMQMVANLFVGQENHIDLARYRIHFFLDRIKDKYYIDIGTLDETFKNSLAIKSGLKAEELNRLILELRKVKNTNYLNKANFVKFSKTIEHFTKKLSIL
jgi:hypothetical protein